MSFAFLPPTSSRAPLRHELARSAPRRIRLSSADPRLAATVIPAAVVPPPRPHRRRPARPCVAVAFLAAISIPIAHATLTVARLAAPGAHETITSESPPPPSLRALLAGTLKRRRGGGGRWGKGAAGDRCLPCRPLGRATREFFPAAKTYSIFIIGKDSPSLFPGSLSIPFACGLSWHRWPSRAV